MTPPPLPKAGPTPQELIAKLPVSFGNPVALRVAFIMSLAIMLLEMIPGLNVLFLFWWLAAGWGAVLLYRRITGMVLSVQAGARLGSITGILTFLAMTVVLALTMAVAGSQVLETMVKQNPEMQQVVNDPPTLAGVFLVVLVVIFCLVVGVCAAGGALGARSIARRASN
ncbi:MAG TPA: hypothetical protein VNH18_12320 [Bryobacteraceae bacterium]|nr:hypothetical protein [Bryobacteraceae bacterium]